MSRSVAKVWMSAVVPLMFIAACGGGSGGGDSGGGGGSGTTIQPGVADEVSEPGTPVLSDRSASGTAQSVYVVLEGQTVRVRENVTIDYATGAVTGNLLSGTDLDDPEYTNPANGEYSRIVFISGSSVFGAVGLDATLPPSGTVTNYREGWVGLNAAIDGDDNYTLEGDAVFTATWSSNDIDGAFVNLSGTGATSGSVSDVGDIIITDADISGDNFSGGTVTGTGLFDDLGGSGTSLTLRGTFFGPEADELGGVITVDDSVDGIRIDGAFQAD